MLNKKNITSSKIEILPKVQNKISYQETTPKRYSNLFFKEACKKLESYKYVLVEDKKNYKKYSKDGINFYVPKVQEFFFWVFTDEKYYIFYDKMHRYALLRFLIIIKKLELYKFKKKYFKETGRCS